MKRFLSLLLAVALFVPAAQAQDRGRFAVVTHGDDLTDFRECRAREAGQTYGVIPALGAFYQCTATGYLPMTEPAGAVPSASATAGVTRLESGSSVLHKTTWTLTDVAVTMTDATTAGNHGGVQLYDFPDGLFYFVGATSDLTVTAGAGGIGDTAAVVCSLGSVVVATDNATLTTTEADYIPSTQATLTGGAGACDGDATTPALFNGTATAADAFLNFAVPDVGSTANDTLTVSGTVTLVWIGAGDN